MAFIVLLKLGCAFEGLTMNKLQQGLYAARIGVLLCTLFGVSPFVRAQNQAITFSATGDVPYGPQEMVKFQQQISNHNRYSPSAFFVHLGDIFTSGACGDTSYALMANVLKSLAVPVYILPGDNETIDCVSTAVGLELWKKYFLNYEQNFCGATPTQRQSARPENWAFMMNGVLFVGINNVGGSSPYQQDAQWTVQQLQTQGSQARAAVILSHADPERSTVFSTPFRATAAAFGKPVLFLHGHGHLWSLGYPFPEKNILRVQVDNGAAEEPIQVTVTTAATMNPDSMFIIKRKPSSSFVIYNMPPCANAGPDQTLTSLAVANLQGAATDDGDPNGNLTTTWSKISGPGTVTFGNAAALATTASFSMSGTYVLRLTANDGQLQKYDEMIFAVNSGARVLVVSTIGSGTVASNPAGGVYNEGTVVTLTATPAAGFRFAGWSGDLTGSNNSAAITMNSNKNVTATFAAIQRNLTVNTIGSGTVTLNQPSGVYNDGAVATLTATPTAGFLFTGWSGDLTGTINPASITMNGNKNVTATFTLIQRILTVNTAGSGSVLLNPPGGVYNDGAVVTLTPQSGTGFHFAGWSGDLTGASNSATLTMNTNKTVTATFALLPAAIVHEETVTGKIANSTAVTTAVPLTGVNGQLYLAAVSMRPKVSVLTVAGLGLNWKLVKAKCAGRNTTGIEIWMAQGTPGVILQGEVVATFAATPNTAVMAVSRFSGAAVANPIGGVITGNTRGMNSSGACSGGIDTSLYAFDFTTTVNGAVIYSAAALKARTHAPGAGYTELAEVQQASGVNTSGLAVMQKAVAAPTTLAVNGKFGGPVDWVMAAVEIKPQLVTQLLLNTVGSGSVTLNPAGSPAFSGGGIYNQGAFVTLTAQNGAGFRFTGWSGDLSGTANPATIAMTANKNVTATFTAVANTNLAKNKPVVASSSYAGRPPENVVDGSADTYWRSLNKLDWLRVDLGVTTTVAQINVNWEESYFAKSYEVQLSNEGMNWNTVYNAIGNTGVQALNFPPATARYVRLNLKENNKSSYRIVELEIYSGSGPAAKRSSETATAIAAPQQWLLEQNYPNPFNPSTQINFGLPQAAHVAIKLYTLNGVEVRTLVDERYPAGMHSVMFHAGHLPSGVYFYEMQTGAVRQVRRLMLVK